MTLESTETKPIKPKGGRREGSGRKSAAVVALGPPKPPAHLRAATSVWFLQVVESYDGLEPHHVRLLTRACESWDRGEQAREALKRHGSLTYDDRFGAPHARPEVAIERDARTAFARLVRELGLQIETP